jgi:hypothetical protein
MFSTIWHLFVALAVIYWISPTFRAEFKGPLAKIVSVFKAGIDALTGKKTEG